jgi:hypothetical protein
MTDKEWDDFFAIDMKPDGPVPEDQGLNGLLLGLFEDVGHAPSQAHGPCHLGSGFTSGSGAL